jgi:hypothetical protein
MEQLNIGFEPKTALEQAKEELRQLSVERTDGLETKKGCEEFCSWYDDMNKKMDSLDGQTCEKSKKCLKEMNPNADDVEKRGIYFGTPFLCESKAGACWQCVAQADDSEADTLGDNSALINE